MVKRKAIFAPRPHVSQPKALAGHELQKLSETLGDAGQSPPLPNATASCQPAKGAAGT